MANDGHYAAIEQRIERFIAIAGLIIAAVVDAKRGTRAGIGVAAGTALCWLNFRWLCQGADGVIRIGLAQAGAANVNVPRSLHVKFFGRLVLLAVAVYAILVWLRLPAFAVVIGLAAVLPAIIFELGYELVREHSR